MHLPERMKHEPHDLSGSQAKLPQERVYGPRVKKYAAASLYVDLI